MKTMIRRMKSVILRLVMCGSFNVICSHKLIESGTIRRYGFVKLGVALLEEMCHCGDKL